MPSPDPLALLSFALFLEAHGLCLSDLHHSITNPKKG